MRRKQGERRRYTEAEAIDGICRNITELLHVVLVKRATLLLNELHEQLSERQQREQKVTDERVADARQFAAAFGPFDPLKTDEPWRNQSDLAHALDHITDLCDALDGREV